MKSSSVMTTRLDGASRDETQSCISAKGGGKEIGVAERRGKVEFRTSVLLR